MKNRYTRKTFRYLFLFGILPFSSFSFSQSDKGSQASWEKKGFQQKVFIENKGQFGTPGGEASVLYGMEEGGSRILFNRTGIRYSFLMTGENSQGSIEPASLKEAERQQKQKSVSFYDVDMKWLDADHNSKIMVEQEVKEYFNYGLSDGSFVGMARGFGKLIYKNLYPKVDAEYTFHPQHGIKYVLILHPGADVSKIRMQFSGSAGPSVDEAGNLHIPTPAGDILDHAPVSFYADDKSQVPSAYILNGDIVSFDLRHDASRTVVIDPWIMYPVLGMNNNVYDIGVDKLGNVYVGGSENPYKIQKYSAAGVLQWTYNTPYSGCWYGDMTSDSAGNSYISTGNLGAQHQKISPAGTMVYNSLNVLLSLEMFNMTFNGSKSSSTAGLLLLGACFGTSVAYVNTITGGMGPFRSPSGLLGGPGVEIRALCSSTNGNFYGLTISQMEDSYGCTTPAQAYTSYLVGFDTTIMNVFVTPSGFMGNSLGYRGVCYKRDQTGSQNAIAASNCCVYTYDGSRLKKHDAYTGVLVKEITVPTGFVGNNSGIYADECDNIYVGTANQIRIYDHDLNLISASGAPGAVYDLKYNPVTNEIVACGNGFVSSHAIVRSCTTPTACGMAVPIKLLDFKAGMQDNQVVLNWSSASEKDCRSYVIERSENAFAFESVDSVPGQGNKSTLTQYRYIDKVEPPLGGIIYYRLKQIDYSGSFSYSAVQTVSLSSVLHKVAVSPNPVRQGENVSLKVNMRCSGQITLSLINALGKELYSSELPCETGENELSVSSSHLKQGMYFLRVTTAESSEIVKILIEE